MSHWEENSLLIERYLDGELTSDERMHFEKMISEDAKLITELELHKQIRKDIRAAAEKKILKAKMTEMHQTFFGYPGSSETKIIPVRNYSGSFIISVAAGLSLLLTAGSLSVYHFGWQQKNIQKEYVEVDRPLDRVNSASSDKKATEEKKDESSILNEPLRAATAFAITSDGWVVTSYHTVKNKKKVKLERVGDSMKVYAADVRFFDKKLDLALLKINDPEFVSLGKIPFTFNPTEASIAQKVFALGYPKDDIVYAEGSISSLSGYKMDSLAYQAGIMVNPGNSGAPLFNEQGEIVGVIAGKNAFEEGATYAIKSKFFLKMLKHVSLRDGEGKIELSTKSQLKGKKITDQVKAIEPFVFIIKV